jgi:hypothetical protein
LAEEQRMSSKQYAKFEKVFYLFGSISKMVSPVRPDEWTTLAEDMWSWANVKVSALVDFHTDGFLEPPPELGAPGTEPPSQNGTGVGNNHKKSITVKSVSVLKSGGEGNRRWALTKVVDMDNTGYTTFAGSRYQAGQTYAIEYEEMENNGRMDLRIKEPK